MIANTSRSTSGSRIAAGYRPGLALALSAMLVAGCGSNGGGAAAPGGETDRSSAAGSNEPASADPTEGAHEHGGAGSSEADQIDVAALAPQLAALRLATAPYVLAPERAAADGYALQITPMIEDMGVHYLNGGVEGFDPARPPVLVYVPTADGLQLGAVEWVFPEEPAEPPFPGATYGDFPAACHYGDGNFIPAETETCAPTHPDTAADFTFWHDALVTLHVWLWYHNPGGIFAGPNPLVRPFNDTASTTP